MIPIDFESDLSALRTACQLAGYVTPSKVSAMWIRDTLSLEDIECSEVFYDAATELTGLEVISRPQPLEFDGSGDLIDRFQS